jgi:hypothetical protein
MKVAVLRVSAPCRTIALMMEVASASEKSLTFYQTTRRNNSEDSNLHNRRHKNLGSHIRIADGRNLGQKTPVLRILVVHP